MSCDIGEATEGLENEQSLILQPFCCLIYITAHSQTLLLLHLRHRSFPNPSVASPTSPGELPMVDGASDRRRNFSKLVDQKGLNLNPASNKTILFQFPDELFSC